MRDKSVRFSMTTMLLMTLASVGVNAEEFFYINLSDALPINPAPSIR